MPQRQKTHLFAPSRLLTLGVSVISTALLSMTPVQPSLAVTGDTLSQSTHFVQPAQADNATQSSNTNASDSITTYQQQAMAQHLADERGWQRLLYYPDTAKTSKIRTSRVHDRRFFVSDVGQQNPHAEMAAMLTALFTQTTQNTPSHQAVQCRFPARTQWLTAHLPITTALPPMPCPELTSWLQTIDPSRAELIFAEEYLNNPASAFGHSFLRLENAKTGQAHILNYVPKSMPNESFLKFSYKSVIAGNTGEFTLEPYEQKIAQYRDHEGRDIWRYRFLLSPSELQQLARLIWEIKDQHLTYYLTTDNCASEILALLNILRPDKDYLANYPLIVAPADIVRNLQRQHMLADHPIYEPSKKSQRQAQLNAITPHTLSQNRSQMPAPPDYFLPANTNPLNAQPLSRVSVGMGEQQHKNFTELGYRLVYHDALDGQAGYPSGFYLEGLSAKLRYFSEPLSPKDNKLQLENFTLLKARSLHPINTADAGKSWGGHLALERISEGQTHAQTSYLVGSVGAEYGWSVAYGQPRPQSAEMPPNLCYGLGTGDIQLGKGLANHNRLGIGATLGCIHQFSPTWRMLAEAKLPYWYESGREGTNGYWQPNASLGVQHDLTRQQSLRLTAQYSWQPTARPTPNPLTTNSLITSPSPTTNPTTTRNTPEILLQYLHYF